MTLSHMRFNNLLFAVSILFAMAVASCSTPKDVAYFQEMAIQTPSQVDVKSVVIKPNDKLSIIVNSRDPMVANMFNLPYTNRLLGQTSALANSNTSQGVSAYTVNQDGDIDFPEPWHGPRRGSHPHGGGRSHQGYAYRARPRERCSRDRGALSMPRPRCSAKSISPAVIR